MSVICDASPLIHLAAIGRLSVLRDLFGEIDIPEAVHREVVVQGVDRPGAYEVHNAEWIHRRAVTRTDAADTWSGRLGRGEAECIALAEETGAGLVVLDDQAARLIARAQRLNVIGTVGVLLTAGAKRLIDFEPALTDLLVSGFRLAPREVERILHLWQTKGGQGA